MKHLNALKWLIVFALMPFMCTFAYGDPVAQPNPLEIVGSSKFYGRITKAQAAEIIEKCAKETYNAKALVEENSFFMGVPSQIYPQTSLKRTITKFKWASVKQIEILQGSIRISYENSFFGTNQHDSLELSGKTYNLADLALAAMTLTGLPLTPEKPVPDASDAVALKNPAIIGEQVLGSAQGTKHRQIDPDLRERLLKLKDLYDNGLISKAVYESKQKELIDSMLDGNADNHK